MKRVEIDFDWDPEKAKLNLRRHKLSFEQAATVFQDPMALSVFDDDHSDNEERWSTMGRAREGAILVVIHTFHEERTGDISIRIISARRALKREAKNYEANV